MALHFIADWLANPDDLGSSLVFATDERLEMLKDATHINYDTI